MRQVLSGAILAFFFVSCNRHADTKTYKDQIRSKFRDSAQTLTIDKKLLSQYEEAYYHD